MGGNAALLRCESAEIYETNVALQTTTIGEYATPL
jgi:hypothetical protein